MFNGARIVGPAIAGFLMAKVGIALCFLIDGVSFIAVHCRVVPDAIAAVTRRARRRGRAWPVARGISLCLGSQPRPDDLLLFAVVGIFGWSYSVLMPAFAHDVLHLGAQATASFVRRERRRRARRRAHDSQRSGPHLPPRIMAFGGVWIFSAMLRSFPSIAT